MTIEEIEKKFKEAQVNMITIREEEIAKIKSQWEKRLGIARCFEGVDFGWSLGFYLGGWYARCKDFEDARKLMGRILSTSNIDKFEKSMDSDGEWKGVGRDDELGLMITVYPSEPSTECEVEVEESISKSYRCRRKDA